MTQIAPPVPFDDIADYYDSSRGGARRAAIFADALSQTLIGDGPLLELGIGTAIVAAELERRGRAVFGADVSSGMLRHAVRRLPGRVLLADASRLPVHDGTVAGVYAIWMLHLVPDLDQALGEVRRVLRPGGRLAVVPASNRTAGDVIGQIVTEMHIGLLGPRVEAGSGNLSESALRNGFSLLSESPITQEYLITPEAMATQLEARNFSALRDVSPSQWNDIVVPAIERLRALPDADMPLTRRTVHQMFIFVADDRRP